MQAFEYLSVLVSIIVGLGLSHLLATAARLIQERDRVQFFLPTLLWMGILFVLQIQIWWAAFEWQSAPTWDFAVFLLFLFLPIGAYMLSVLLVPDFDRPGDLDQRAGYFRNRPWFFGLLTLIPLFSLAHETLHTGGLVVDADLFFRLGFAGLALVGFFVRNATVHWIVTGIFGTGFAAYIGLLFLQLPR